MLVNLSAIDVLCDVLNNGFVFARRFVFWQVDMQINLYRWNTRVPGLPFGFTSPEFATCVGVADAGASVNVANSASILKVRICKRITSSPPPEWMLNMVFNSSVESRLGDRVFQREHDTCPATVDLKLLSHFRAS